jgi:hypothetical protein
MICLISNLHFFYKIEFLVELGRTLCHPLNYLRMVQSIQEASNCYKLIVTNLLIYLYISVDSGTVIDLEVKKKVKVSLYTPWRRIGERMYSSYSFLTSVTRWGWVVSVTPRPRFTPGERTPGIRWIGGWVGPRAGLDTGARRKILCPCRGSNLDHPIVRHHTAWATISKRKEKWVGVYTAMSSRQTGGHSPSW